MSPLLFFHFHTGSKCNCEAVHEPFECKVSTVCCDLVLHYGGPVLHHGGPVLHYGGPVLHHGGYVLHHGGYVLHHSDLALCVHPSL